MPALRALALLGFLGGTALMAIGVATDDTAVALVGAAAWGIGVVIGLFAARLLKYR